MTNAPINKPCVDEPARLSGMERLVATTMRALCSLWPFVSSDARAQRSSELLRAIESLDYATARRLVLLGAPLGPIRKKKARRISYVGSLRARRGALG